MYPGPQGPPMGGDPSMMMQGGGGPPMGGAPPVQGRGMLDLATLPPEIIQALIQVGILGPDGSPVGMEQLVGGGPQQPDPRMAAIQNAIGAPQMAPPQGF